MFIYLKYEDCIFSKFDAFKEFHDNNNSFVSLLFFQDSYR